MEKFAILHDAEPSQILITLDWDTDDKAYKVTARVDFEGVVVSPALGFKDQESAVSAFAKFEDTDFAKNFINSIASDLFDGPIFK